MFDNQLVSIVLPCYNGADHLAASIESCIAQTYSNWELIIVNDCSKDNSLEIMKAYESKDSRIRVIDNEKNLKLPGALNRGFSETKGLYLTWTSHDNRMAPTMIEEMVSYFDAHPGIGLVTANYAAFSLTTGEQLYEVSMPDPQRNLPRFNTICYAFMYRREVLDKIGGYDESLFLIEDYEYWVRIWLHFPIGKIDKVLYYTGVGNTTLTMSRKKEVAKKLLEVRLLYFDDFTKALRDTPKELRNYLIAIADELGFVRRITFLLKSVSIASLRLLVYYICWHTPKRWMKRFGVYSTLKKIVK